MDTPNEAQGPAQGEESLVPLDDVMVALLESAIHPNDEPDAAGWVDYYISTPNVLYAITARFVDNHYRVHTAGGGYEYAGPGTESAGWQVKAFRIIG